MNSSALLKIPALILLIMIASTDKADAQSFNVFEGKFTVHETFGLPGLNYGLSADDWYLLDNSYKYQVSFGLKMGSMWSFYSWDHFGIGLKIGWVDMSFARKADDFYIPTWYRYTFDFSFGEMGPLFIFAVNNNIAFDVYYLLRPQFLYTTTLEVGDYYYDYYDNPFYEDEYPPFIEAFGMGFGQLIGFTFRLKVLSVGVEYIFGDIPDMDYVDEYGYSEGPRINNNCLRFMVGVAF